MGAERGIASCQVTAVLAELAYEPILSEAYPRALLLCGTPQLRMLFVMTPGSINTAAGKEPLIAD